MCLLQIVIRVTSFSKSRHGMFGKLLVVLAVGLAQGTPPSCPNTCVGAPEYANDGVCDDGGPGSTSGVCAFGALLRRL